MKLPMSTVKTIWESPMNPDSIFWSVFRVLYMVEAVYFSAFLTVYLCDVKPENRLHEFIGCIGVNTCVVVIFWALVPWEKLGRKKEWAATRIGNNGS